MKLAVSNLAWDNYETEYFLPSLKEIGVDKIECVLTKIKPWSELKTTDILEFKEKALKHGLEPYSIQSLFYGVNCSSFLDKEIMLKHINKIVEYAKLLGVKILVFGSPTLRKKYDGWESDVYSFFISVEEILKETDITLVIEPNSTHYKSDFFCSVSEITYFLKKNSFKTIKTMIDTHNLILENLQPSIEFLQNMEYIHHIHISEVGLKEVDFDEKHLIFSNVLKSSNYKDVITYEVIKHENIIKSVQKFFEIYK
jgi:sugar phosphate isomerase/epimerase